MTWFNASADEVWESIKRGSHPDNFTENDDVESAFRDARAALSAAGTASEEWRDEVYVCSNRECDAVWDADPHGHCPKCLNLTTGAGWSTTRRSVSSLRDGILDSEKHTLSQGEGQ